MYSDDVYELTAVRRLSYGQKALYYWVIIDGQITNGGFLQVYYNKFGQYVPTVIKGLEYIGDKKTAALIQKAQNIYNQNIDIIEEISEGDLFGTDAYERLDEFTPLEDEYYRIDEKTWHNMEKFIRENPNEFFLDEEGNEIDSTYSGECITYHRNGKVKEQFHLENGIIQGNFTSYFESGNLKEHIIYSTEKGTGLESFYHDGLLVCPIVFIGKPTGEKENYYENGNIKFRSTIDSANKLIREESFDESGQLRMLEYKTMATKIEKIGEHKKWYANGQLMESGFYLDAYQRIGEWREFFPEGNVRLQGEFTKSEFLVHQFYNENGEILLKDGTGLFISNNSFLKGHTFSIGCNRVEQEYKDYKLDGVCKGFNNDVLIAYKEFKNGKAHGYERTYYKNGKLRQENKYKNGELIATSNFQKSDDPRGKVTFQFLMKDEWLTKRGFQTVDQYPVCINEKEIKQKIKFPQILFQEEYLYIDIDATTCLWLKVNEKGKVTSVDFSSSYLTNGEEFIEIAEEMVFKPAIKNNLPVESCIYIIATFEIE